MAAARARVLTAAAAVLTLHASDSLFQVRCRTQIGADRVHSFPAFARPSEKLSAVWAIGINRVPATNIPRQRRE